MRGENPDRSLSTPIRCHPETDSKTNARQFHPISHGEIQFGDYVRNNALSGNRLTESPTFCDTAVTTRQLPRSSKSISVQRIVGHAVRSPTMSRSRRAMSFVVIATAVAIAILLSPMNFVRAAEQKLECSHGDIVYIGVRGSGQTSGMGEQTWNYFNQSLRPAAQRAGLDARSVHIDYTAAPINQFTPFDIGGYIGSYNVGLQVLESKVRLTLNEFEWAGHGCDNAKIVVSGYSQGALIVHRLLQRQASITGFANHFGGAILFADPDRFRNDGLQKSIVGLGQGIAQSLPGTGASRSPLTGRFSTNSYSICAATDLVCDFTTGVHTGSFATQGIALGVWLHLNAYTQQYILPFYGFAANELTRKVVASSKPPVITVPDTTNTAYTAEGHEMRCGIVFTIIRSQGVFESGSWYLIDENGNPSADRFGSTGGNYDRFTIIGTEDYRPLMGTANTIKYRVVTNPGSPTDPIDPSTARTVATLSWAPPQDGSCTETTTDEPWGRSILVSTS